MPVSVEHETACALSHVQPTHVRRAQVFQEWTRTPPADANQAHVAEIDQRRVLDKELNIVERIRSKERCSWLHLARVQTKVRIGTTAAAIDLDLGTTGQRLRHLLDLFQHVQVDLAAR